MRKLLVLCLMSACFHEPDALASEPIAFEVEDWSGTSAERGEAPRDVVLTLHFASSPAALVPVLIAGEVEASLAQALSFTRPSSALMPYLRALDVVQAPHAMMMRPREALTAGRYTLLWPNAEPSLYAFAVSASPALGARWVQSAPGDGATIAPNLARALVRFDGHVLGDLAAAITLRAEAPVDATVEVVRCAMHGLPEGDCAFVTPRAALAQGAHTLCIEGSLQTPGGAPIAPSCTRFTVSGEVDLLPPTLSPERCAPDEVALEGACLLAQDQTLTVRGSSGEPVTASLIAGARRTAAFGTTFALALDPSEVEGTAMLRLRDLAGNVSELALAYRLAPALAQVFITEVRADPRGREPAQEYVELLNSGTESVSLMGFTLSTDAFEAGRKVASAASLAPGERVLLVAPDFDPRDTSDGVLPSGVRTLPLSGALSLANTGGTLLLRDAQGRRLSRARTYAPWVEGQCSLQRGPQSRAGEWVLDARGTCTPGADSP